VSGHDTENAYAKLSACHESIKDRIPFSPELALVLGSGLGGYGDTMKIEAVIDYHDIEGFPISTVAGHKGRFLFGTVGPVKVVCMQGRIHYYEGYNMTDVVLPTRLMHMMGARILFLTNASGGVNTSYHAGDFMIIRDHISSFVPSPLLGQNIDELGTRFPDMCEIYDRDLIDIIRRSAREEKIDIQEGTYIQLTGPNFETPAEIRMCRALGADAVGMSTAVEAMAANHMRMKICGISCISNMAAGITDSPLTHQEVQETADRRAADFTRLITRCVINMNDVLSGMPVRTERADE